MHRQPTTKPATTGNGENGPDSTSGSPNGAPKFPVALGDNGGKDVY